MFSSHPIFKNRKVAGQKLGEFLLKKNFNDPIVFALPRGGVTVAREVARILKVSLDVVVSRKIGAPSHPEYGIGAISEDEVPLFNPDVVGLFNVTGNEVMSIVADEKAELRRRISLFRPGRKLQSVKNKSVILIDDGLATGVTAAAAGKFLWTLEPKEIILAVPVGPGVVDSLVNEQFDEIICLYRPMNFRAVGLWYEEFYQVEDEEVMAILNEYHPRPSTLNELR